LLKNSWGLQGSGIGRGARAPPPTPPLNPPLDGTIPGNLGSLTDRLAGVVLAHNNLSGSIPEHLGNSTSLLRLDRSFNNLQGDVLVEVFFFRNLTGLSIIGNNKLCGGIPQLRLPLFKL